jgi:hypothetical protein
MNRRNFILGTTLSTAGMAAWSYARSQGTNDRIRLGGIGPGDRGSGRVAAAQTLSAEMGPGAVDSALTIGENDEE